jgi:hypothetical protein
VIALRIDPAGDVRVAPVGSDHHPSPLDHRGAILAVSADAGHGAVLDLEAVHVEPLADLGTGMCRGVDEDFVQQVRRGAHPAEPPPTDREVPPIVTGPKSNEYRSIQGHPVASTSSSRPHSRSAATPCGWITSVDSVSLGKPARSTTSTR